VTLEVVGGLVAHQFEGVAAFDQGLALSEEAMDGIITMDGKLPVNPSGGLKAKGHPIGATGVSMHALCAMQLCGEAPEGMQVEGAKLAGIFNMGGAAVANYVSILERIR
jgi:acetyl-CoA C-acetyltransferase